MKNNRSMFFLFALFFCNNFVVAQNLEPLVTQSPLHSANIVEQKQSHNTLEKEIMISDAELRGSDTKKDRAINGFGGHANNQPSISMSEVVVKVVIGLGIVLVVIGLLAWLSNKTGINRLANNKKIRLRESVSLSSKEKLVIVDFAGESLLLGVGGGKVSLLKSVPQLPLTQAQQSKSSLGAKNALDFQHKLNEFLLKGSQS